jgi:hypothetical protein
MRGNGTRRHTTKNVTSLHQLLHHVDHKSLYF